MYIFEYTILKFDNNHPVIQNDVNVPMGRTYMKIAQSKKILQ
jgi:hypothetical protein